MWFSDFDWSWSFKSVPQMLPDFRISRHIATLRPLGVEPLSAQLLKTAPTQVILHLICIEFGYTGFPYTGNIWTSQSIGFGWLWRSSHSGLDFGLSLIHLFAALLQKGCTPGKKTAGSWPQVQRRPFDIVSQHENVPDVDGSKPMTWLNQHPSTSQKNHPGARVLSHTQIWYDLHQFTTKEPQIFVALFIQSFAW